MANEKFKNVLHNNQQNFSISSTQIDTVTQSTKNIQGVQSKNNMQGDVGNNQIKSIYQQCNYHGMQQCHCPNPCGVQLNNVNPVINQNNQQVQYQETQINYQRKQHIGYTPSTFNQNVASSTGTQQPAQNLSPVMSQSYQSSATQSYASNLNINRKVRNSYQVQQPDSNKNKQEGQPQGTQMNYQPHQILNAGYMPGQTENTSNQHVTSLTGLQQSGRHLNPATSQTYPTMAAQSYVSSANDVTASNKIISNSYKVQQQGMQYPGYNQNYKQRQHQATQMVYQPTQHNMLSKSGNVTTKQNFDNSNQVDPTPWPQSNVIATNQIQYSQQNFYTVQKNLDPFNTASQMQTNSIAQQSTQSYNYQPTSQNFNVQQNPIISASSLDLPHQSLRASSSQTSSSLPQTLTRNASKEDQQ